jgi:hypothetical protein
VTGEHRLGDPQRVKAGIDKEGVQVSLQIHSHEEEEEMMARGEGH